MPNNFRKRICQKIAQASLKSNYDVWIKVQTGMIARSGLWFICEYEQMSL